MFVLCSTALYCRPLIRLNLLRQLGITTMQRGLEVKMGTKEVEKPLHGPKHQWLFNSNQARRESCPVLSLASPTHQMQTPLQLLLL